MIDKTYFENRIKLIDQILSTQEIEDLVMNDQCGALTTFCGRVRNHNEGQDVLSIFYEAYETMAIKVMQEIIEEADQKFMDARSAVHHRLGELEIGDDAVIVAVAAAHRQVTFEACAWIIDQLKARVPIFKHERRKNGVTWVGLGP